MTRRPVLLLLSLVGCSGLFGIDFDGNGGSGPGGAGAGASGAGASGAGGSGGTQAGGSGGSGAGGGETGGGGAGGGPTCDSVTTVIELSKGASIGLKAFKALDTGGFIVAGDVLDGTVDSVPSNRPFLLYLNDNGERVGEAVALSQVQAVVFDAVVWNDNVYAVGYQDPAGAMPPEDGWIVRVEPGVSHLQTKVVVSTSQLASQGQDALLALDALATGVVAAGRCGAQDLEQIPGGGAMFMPFSFDTPMELGGTFWSCPTAFGLDLKSAGPAGGSLISAAHTTTSSVSSTEQATFLAGYTVGGISGGPSGDAWFLARLGPDNGSGGVDPVQNVVGLAAFNPQVLTDVHGPLPKISTFRWSGQTFVEAAFPTDALTLEEWTIQRFDDNLTAMGSGLAIIADTTIAVRLDATAEGIAAVAHAGGSADFSVGASMFLSASSVAFRVNDDHAVAQSIVPQESETTVDYALIENEQSMVLVGVAEGEANLTDGDTSMTPIPGTGKRLFFHRACLPSTP